AIVEKEAEHGGRTLYNLVRNMLPTAAGTRFNQTWNAGEQVVVQNAFQPYRDTEDGEFMLVVFVADEETKDIYQAAFVDLPASVGSGSREGLAERFEQVTLYPNPTSGLTNGRFTVAIPAALTHEQQWTVYDMLGRPHLRGTWPLNTWEVEIDASRLAEGTYIFQMEGIKQFFVVMRD
ncbi:MAG: T9SS type A sorting domain-containing protein, partial [Bacteroidota bacterium]